MTKKEAIKKARENVSELYRFGENWRFNYYDRKCNVWRESCPRDYFGALFFRSMELIYQASLELTGDDYLASEKMAKYHSGRWTEFV